MQKALKLMNIQLPEVLTDVTGVTGMAILRAIVAGEHRGEVLAKLRQSGCKRSEQDVVQALTGTCSTTAKSGRWVHRSSTGD